MCLHTRARADGEAWWLAWQDDMNASFRQHAERFESVSQEVLNNAPLQELQQRVTSVLAGVDGRVARVEGEVRSKAWITSVESTEQTVVSLGACWDHALCRCRVTHAHAAAPLPVYSPQPHVKRTCSASSRSRCGLWSGSAGAVSRTSTTRRPSRTT